MWIYSTFLCKSSADSYVNHTFTCESSAYFHVNRIFTCESTINRKFHMWILFLTRKRQKKNRFFFQFFLVTFISYLISAIFAYKHVTFWWRFDWFLEVPHWTQPRSEEHTSELQSLRRISYAVFCFPGFTTRPGRRRALSEPY